MDFYGSRGIGPRLIGLILAARPSFVIAYAVGQGRTKIRLVAGIYYVDFAERC